MAIVSGSWGGTRASFIAVRSTGPARDNGHAFHAPESMVVPHARTHSKAPATRRAAAQRYCRRPGAPTGQLAQEAPGQPADAQDGTQKPGAKPREYGG